MPKPIAALRYELKTIGLQLVQLPEVERSLFKAQELAKITLTNFTQGIYDVEILEQPKEKNGYLFISVKAKKSNVDMVINNPLIFKNPPIMVPDGTVHQEFRASIGAMIDVDNYVEDPVEALKQIIVDTLRTIK